MAGTVTVIASTPNAEWVVETAYLQCQARWDDIEENRAEKTFDEHVLEMMRWKHFSVLEHVCVTFSIRGVSRSCSHQIVRHRIGIAISQMSMRHTLIGDAESLVIPPSIRDDPEAAGAYVNVAGLSQGAYKALLNAGIPMEDARFILPIGTTTELVMTFSARALMHFLRLRMDKHAQWEVRFVANEIYQYAKDWMPTVFDEKYHQYWE